MTDQPEPADDMPDHLRHLYMLAIRARLAHGAMVAAHPAHPQHIQMTADAAMLVDPLRAGLEEALAIAYAAHLGSATMGELTTATPHWATDEARGATVEYLRMVPATHPADGTQAEPSSEPEVRHALTSHGHPCCGKAPSERPNAIARCGGVHMCKTCAANRDAIHGASSEQDGAAA